MALPKRGTQIVEEILVPSFFPSRSHQVDKTEPIDDMSKTIFSYEQAAARECEGAIETSSAERTNFVAPLSNNHALRYGNTSRISMLA